MDVANVLNGGLNAGDNTGIGERFDDVKFIKGLIFVPKGKTYTTASIAAFVSALQADLLADLPSQRAYPIGDFRAPTDNSEAAVIQTFADGSKAVVRGAYYDWTFQFVTGGATLSAAMQRANGLNRWFFVIDEGGILRGVDAGPGLIQGVNPNLNYTPPFKLNTGAAVTEYSTQVNFSADQLNVNQKFLDFSNDGGLQFLLDLSGLLNILTTAPVARVTDGDTDTITVGGNTDCGTVNMYDLFADELNDITAFQVLNKASGLPVAITAITQVPGSKAWALSIDTRDDNYDADPNSLLVGFAGPTELADLEVVGYESNLLTI